MVKHNNVIPNVHFHKDWKRRVKTWFDQAPKKKARRLARAKKAARIFPRPVSGSLRPVVHAPTNKYNMKERYGRGFTFDELKEAGIGRHQARTIGICVDHRRRNRSERTLQQNVQRLKLYQQKLVVFPRNRGKVAKGDSAASDAKQTGQLKGTILPLSAKQATATTHLITEAEKKKNVVASLRKLRADARLHGIRKKKAAEKAEKAAQLNIKK